MINFKAGTPEHFFVIPPEQPKELNIDVLSTLLHRSIAVISLIQSDGEDLQEGFSLNQEHILNSLYCIEGMLIQAKKMIDNSV